MGVLVKYNIAIEGEYLVYIGSLLDKQPHCEVAKIIVAIQPQITAQDQAEKERSDAAWQAARQAWFDEETARRAASKSDEPAVEPKEGT